MQREIGDEVHIGDLVTPFKSVGKLAAFDNASLKFTNIRRLIEKGIYNADIARYIPGTLDLVFQRKFEIVKAIEQPADTTFKDKETLDFVLILDKNYYANLKSLHICFLVKFKKLSNVAQDLDVNL